MPPKQKRKSIFNIGFRLLSQSMRDTEPKYARHDQFSISNSTKRMPPRQRRFSIINIEFWRKKRETSPRNIISTSADWDEDTSERGEGWKILKIELFWERWEVPRIESENQNKKQHSTEPKYASETEILVSNSLSPDFSEWKARSYAEP